MKEQMYNTICEHFILEMNILPTKKNKRIVKENLHSLLNVNFQKNKDGIKLEYTPRKIVVKKKKKIDPKLKKKAQKYYLKNKAKIKKYQDKYQSKNKAKLAKQKKKVVAKRG